jgi:phage terminase small subunit
MERPDMRLTARREKFVAHYLVSGNGTRSAIAAGYSPRTARAIASELLGNPAIQAALEAGRARQAERLNAEGAAFLNELGRLSEISICGMYDEKTDALLPPSKWPREIFDIIKELKIRPRKNAPPKLSIKFVDRHAILEMIGNSVGAFVRRRYPKTKIRNR